MPSTYTPRRSILSSTDATPIVLTFSAGHNFTTGQTVLVAGHLVNSNANVLTTVTVIDGTHASLDGTTGTGAGAGGATGVVVTAPTGLTVPSDGDDVNASAFNSGIEGDADAAAYAIETGGRLKAMLFQTHANFPVPANCNYVTVDSVSGGGGGGGGARPDNGSPTTKYAGGGGGGGGSPMRRLGMSVTPGTLVAVVVGAGGTAGVGATANNTAGADGGNGTASTFGGKQTSPVGGGGKGGVLASAVGAFGGLPLNTFSSAITASGVQCTNFLPCGGGSGGPGNSSGAQANGTQGAGNESTASGGPGGSSGNTVTGLGGSGGGGGAGGGDTFTAIPPAGLYTNVNVGGTGGAGSATTAAVGVAGTGGEANSGQGGGGGGGGGNGATASGNGGAGGAGATGKVIVWYIVGPNQ